LKRVTQAVRSRLRSADIIGRYGGDEFVILFPHTSAEDAFPLASRIHSSIAGISLKTVKRQLKLSISIGIAQTVHTPAPDSGPTDTLENLFIRADQALYAAKQTVKNRTVIYGAKQP
jgi:diguanylate cyclase (GGDEF)-like protein